MRFLKYPVAFALWFVWVVASAGLVVYGRKLHRIERASALYWDGSTDGAIAAFRDLEQEFRRHSWLARLVSGDRDRVLHNYLRLLYLREDYDSVIVHGEAALLDRDGAAPLVRYWLGNAYYRKAVSGEVEEEDALAWLRRAGEQYRAAVIDASGDWDVKYNHELVQTMLRKLDKQPPQRVFEVLRPQDKPSPRPPTRKIG
ncbi:MAG: hypothetical protein HY337_01375 [Gemmatimonadetes bacterium]|nr:hypothetical protein [Gemmatimonadota bacterium]